MWRSIVGVPVGAILWMAGFFTFAIALGQIWPDYAAHGRTWMSESVFTFTSAQAACSVVLWALAEVVAGFVTMKIARDRRALWVLAVLIAGYLALMHLVLYWPRFPWWYNLGVAIPALPLVLLGGRLADGRAARHFDETTT